MIKSFRHKGLAAFFERADGSKLRADLRARAGTRLRILNAAERLEDLNVPGFSFHPLRGKPQRYSLHVNGPWCVTFEWTDGDAWRVDLEQYH